LEQKRKQTEGELASERTERAQRLEQLEDELAAAAGREAAMSDEIESAQRKVDEANARAKAAPAQSDGPTAKRVAAELKTALADRDAAAERASRAEAHAAELQAMLEGFGRERAQLRSEAGALRARVESLTSAASRARSLIDEANDLRSDSLFGHSTPSARVERVPVSHPPPPPAPVDESSGAPVPLPRPTRKR